VTQWFKSRWKFYCVGGDLSNLWYNENKKKDMNSLPPMLTHIISIYMTIFSKRVPPPDEISIISSNHRKGISITCLLGDGSVVASCTSLLEFWSYIQDSVSEIELLQLETQLKAWSMSEFLAELEAVFSLPRSRDWPLEWLVSAKLEWFLLNLEGVKRE